MVAKTLDSLDALFRPSPAKIAEQQRIAAKLAEFKRDDAMFKSYTQQRDMGFAHDKIIHLYPCWDARYFREWYRDDKISGSSLEQDHSENAARFALMNEGRL